MQNGVQNRRNGTYFWNKWVRPVGFAFNGAPASVDGISRNHSGIYEFLRWHTEFTTRREYAVSPNSAAADNRFLGVGTHPSLLIQSVRMGLKFDEFPQRLNVSPEARRNKTLRKQSAERNGRFNRGFFGLKQFDPRARSALCSWLLNCGPPPFCPCKPFSYKAYLFFSPCKPKYTQCIFPDMPCMKRVHRVKIPGHALHEKGLLRRKGVVPLVGSKQRALLVPLINR